MLLSASVFATQSALAENGFISIIASAEDKQNSSHFVEFAVAYAKENGKDKALKEFRNKTGQFVSGDLYIYAYDSVELALPIYSFPNL